MGQFLNTIDDEFLKKENDVKQRHEKYNSINKYISEVILEFQNIVDEYNNDIAKSNTLVGKSFLKLSKEEVETKQISDNYSFVNDRVVSITVYDSILNANIHTARWCESKDKYSDYKWGWYNYEHSMQYLKEFLITSMNNYINELVNKI